MANDWRVERHVRWDEDDKYWNADDDHAPVCTWTEEIGNRTCSHTPRCHYVQVWHPRRGLVEDITPSGHVTYWEPVSDGMELEEAMAEGRRVQRYADGRDLPPGAVYNKDSNYRVHNVKTDDIIPCPSILTS